MSRPRVEAMFDRLEASPVPRVRCQHLAIDASSLPRLLCSWNPGAICCPTCAGQARDRVLAHGGDCPSCSEPVTAHALRTYTRHGGAITLLIGLCERCARQENADRRPEPALNRRPAFTSETHLSRGSV